MLKVGGLRLVISMLIVFGISINLFAARPLNDFKPYYEDLKNYIPFKNCNLVHNKIYEVCWNLKNGMPDSGWAIIDPLKMDSENISKKPSFYKYQEGKIKTMLPNMIKNPFHKGHIFAKDEDFDYDKEDLKLTYNMLNITPMYGKVNVGIWRKIENRGRELASKVGPVLSITKIDYSEESKFGFGPGKYPILFTRIYITEDTVECYQAENNDSENSILSTHVVSCISIMLK